MDKPSRSSNGDEETVLNPEEFEVLDIEDIPGTNPEEGDNDDFDEAEEMYEDAEEGDSNFKDSEELDYMTIAEDDCEVKEASLLYEGHSDSVLCCSVSSCGSLIATGSLDDSGHVFNPYTGAAVLKCSGHSESVEFACLSHDSQFVATGDLDGFVQVWRIRDGESCFSFHTGSEIRWLEWHKSSHIVFCGTESGEVWVWLVPKGITKTLSNPGTSVESGCCTPDGVRFKPLRT
ncbi:WD40 repeat [Trinorchestia longiramus]|nr:WD40 repeat [Trinorchestia longiramus]